MLTPETRADIRAKANDKLAAEVEVNRLGGWLAPAPVDSEIDLARRDWAVKSNALTAVLSTPTIIYLLDASEPVAGRDAGPMAVYDAGLFSISGGGNVDWWLDYLRTELGRAREFYDDQYEQLRAAYARLQNERDAAVAEVAGELTAYVERLRGELAVMIALADQYVQSDVGREAIAEARAALAGSAP